MARFTLEPHAGVCDVMVHCSSFGAQTVLLTVDARGVVLSAAGPIRAVLGYDVQDLNGLAVDVIYPAHTRWSYQEACSATQPHSVVRRTSRGALISVLRKVSVIAGMDGSVVGFMEQLQHSDRSASLPGIAEHPDATVSERAPVVATPSLLVDQAPYPVFLVDQAGNIAELNRAARELFGYAEGELNGQPVELLVPPASRLAHASHVRDFFRAPSWDAVRPGRDVVAYRRDGREFPAQISLGTVQTPARSYVLASVVDLTMARTNERLLRDKELRFRQMAESLPQLVISFVPNGDSDYCSPQWQEYTGLAADQHARWRELIHPADQVDHALAWTTALRDGTGFEAEYRLRRHDGSYRWFDVRVTPLRDSEGTLTKWFSSCTDVDEARSVREDLRAVRAQLAAALEAGRMGAWVRKVPAGESWMDDQLLQVFGTTREALARRPDGLLSFVHPDDRARVEAELQRLSRDGATVSLEFRAIRGDGAPVWLACRCRTELNEHREPVAIAGVTWDVTVERAARESQREALKLESLGTLASGIAHDFNNVLQAVGGHAQLALLSMPAGQPARPHLEQILRGTDHGVQLVRRILSFGRRERTERVNVDVREAVREALELTRVALPPSITLGCHVSDEPLHVVACATELHQIVINLVTNAMHATSARGGTIEVSVGRAATGELAVSGKQHGAHAKRFVVVTVQDQGEGMTDAVRARIFDRFFTTKPEGVGTGLGLSMVHSLVAGMNGWIDVTSKVGVGTTFRIYLPEAQQPDVCHDSGANDLSSHARYGHVLYVDDDATLGRLIEKMLETSGFDATICHTPEQALALLRERPYDFDLVLSDVSMPSMSGFELTERLLALRADLPVVLMSGFVDAEQRRASKSAGARELLAKPLRMHELARALERHLLPTAHAQTA